MICLRDIDVDWVPKKATDWFSVLDVAINKPIKTHLKTSFSIHCTDQITHQLKSGVNPENVKLDVRTSQIKPLAGTWIINCFNDMKKNEKELIAAGWKKVEEHIEKFK
jgi:hypothetical protein